MAEDTKVDEMRETKLEKPQPRPEVQWTEDNAIRWLGEALEYISGYSTPIADKLTLKLKCLLTNAEINRLEMKNELSAYNRNYPLTEPTQATPAVSQAIHKLMDYYPEMSKSYNNLVSRNMNEKGGE